MHRTLTLINRVLSVGLTLYVICLIFWPLPPLQERSIFVLWIMLIHFLNQSIKKPGLGWIVGNMALCLVTIVVFGYVAIFHDTIAETVGFPTQLELVLGIAAVILVLEATRSAMGLGLTAVIVAFLAYALFGEFLPYEFGGHTGFGVDRIINASYLTTNGIFGIVVYTMYKYVFLFILFGCMLETTGALRFIIDLAYALVGNIRGGPAMIATVSSGLFGSISGSAVANVAVVGSVTIPMMKKMGFEPHVAGAVEAAASNGGQLMPPVMGAAAFLMAQFLGISYLQVCKAAALPAIIYYVSIGISIYFYATRNRLFGIPKSELPKLTKVLFTADALVFLGGLGSLITFLVLRMSPSFAVLWAMAVMLVVSIIGKRPITPSNMVRVFEQTPKIFVEIGVASAGVGIIVGIVMLTGLAVRFSSIIVSLAHGNLMSTLGLTMLASFILGMGLPTTVCYILLSMLISPALTQLGVLPLASQMFIFYSGLLSMVTPPVALAAYAGASLAGANMWRTGITATLLSLPAYILPYIFVYDPSLLLVGDNWSGVAVAVARSLLGCSLLSYSIIGPFKDGKDVALRVTSVGSAVALIWPAYWADAVGLVLLFTVVVVSVLSRKTKSA